MRPEFYADQVRRYGTNPGFLQQQNTLRDALVASVSLDAFNKHADRVRMANIAQMVNVLQAMILTKGDKMLLAPTYHVFEMYTVHHDAVLLPIVLDGGTYTYRDHTMPSVSATASRDAAGRMHLTLTNVDPDQPRTVNASIRGVTMRAVSGCVLTSGQMNGRNTFGAPGCVYRRPTQWRPPHGAAAAEVRRGAGVEVSGAGLSRAAGELPGRGERLTTGMSNLYSYP